MPLTPRKTILLVEDEALIALSEKMALEKYGYAVLMVNTGEAAIEATRDRSDIDLVLMDINLGTGIDGTQAAAAMLAERDLPIIFLSSHSERDVVEKTEALTSYGYVVKNSSITVLDASIKMAFRLFEEKEKSKELNNRLNTTLDAIPDLMFVVDKDGNFESYHNQPSPIALALDEDRIIGSNLRDIFPPDEVERQLALYRVCLDTGRIQTHQYDLVIDGKRQYFSLQLARLDASRVLSTIHDITRQEEAFAQKEALAERFAFACEAGGIGIWEYDLATGTLVWDDQSFRLFGTTAGRFPSASQAWLALAQPEDRLRSEAALQQAAHNAITYDDEFRVIWPDGSLHTLHSTARLRRAPDGTALSFIGVHLDVTRLRLEEDALQQSMAMFTTLFRTIPLPVIIIDAEENRYIDANDAAYRLSGYTHDEMLGRNSVELGLASEQDRAQAVKLLREKGSFKDLEFGLTTKDGQRRSVLVSGQLVRTKHGSYLIQTLLDITERKTVEAHLRRNTDAIELILREVHHRIKNNMNTIGSLLAIQADSLPDGAAKAALEDAERRVQSMAMLYDQLYRGLVVTEASIAEYLSPLIDSVVANFPNATSVRVVKRLDDFVLDARQLQPIGIIVNELLTNSMKYAFVGRDGGTITIQAAKTDTRVVLSVGDDGIGMPESINADTTTGFGFRLIQALAEQLRGSIQIDRAGGTTVALEFEAHGQNTGPA